MTNKLGQNLRIYCDFDGTITVRDIGDELFKVHGAFEPYNSMLKRKEMGIYEYWQTLCNSLPAGFSEEDVRRFALEQEVDAYFTDFCRFLEGNSMPLTVVSDGFSSYIEPIIRREGMECEIICNTMQFSEGAITPIYRAASESCKCFCASCKRNFVLADAPPGDVIVYIGDGYSDFCIAAHSDIVFAKKALAAYCNEKRIPHYPFKTFFDVKKILSGLIARGDYKTRHQAQLARKSAFETE